MKTRTLLSIVLPSSALLATCEPTVESDADRYADRRNGRKVTTAVGSREDVLVQNQKKGN